MSCDVTSEIQPAEEQSASHNTQASAAGSPSSAQYEPASPYQGTTWVLESCSELAGKAHDFLHGQVRLHAAWHVGMPRAYQGRTRTSRYLSMTTLFAVSIVFAPVH